MFPDEEPRDGEHPVPDRLVGPEVIRAGLALSLLLILPALLLLYLLPNDSAEFAISLVTLALGCLLLGFVGVLYWLVSRN